MNLDKILCNLCLYDRNSDYCKIGRVCETREMTKQKILQWVEERIEGWSIDFEISKDISLVKELKEKFGIKSK